MRLFLRLPAWLIRKAAQRGWVRPGHKYIRRWWDAQANRWRYEYYEAQQYDDHKGSDAFVHVVNGRIAVATEYDPKLKDQLKAMGGKWDPDSKSWTFDPQTYVEKVRKILKHVVYHPKAIEVLGLHLPQEEREEVLSQGPGAQPILPPEQQESRNARDVLQFLQKHGVRPEDLRPGVTYRISHPGWPTIEARTEGVGQSPHRVSIAILDTDNTPKFQMDFEVEDGKLLTSRYGFRYPGTSRFEWFKPTLSTWRILAEELANLENMPSTQAQALEGVQATPEARTPAPESGKEGGAEVETPPPQATSPSASGTDRFPDGFPRPSPQALRYYSIRGEKVLRPEQLEDVQKILGRMYEAFTHSRPAMKGMVLANGTGTGKTYVFGSVIASHVHKGLESGRTHRALVVVPNKDIAAQVEEVLSQFTVGSGEQETPLKRGTHYEIATLADVRDPKKREKLREWAQLLVIDEAHRVKNAFGSSGSQQGKGALELVQASQFALYSSATPFDRPWEAKYLAFVGINRVGNAKSFDDFIQNYGVRIANTQYGKEYRFVGTTEDLKRLHNDLVRAGFLTKRLYKPEAPVSYDTPTLELAPEDRTLLEEVRRRFLDAPSLLKALGINLQRAILERAKARAILPLIEKELQEGRSVAVFTQFLREKDLSKEALEEELLLDQLDDAMPDSARSILRKKFHERLQGLDIHLESPVRMIAERFKDLPGGVALYTGEQTESQLKKAKEAFNRGQTKLMVLTAAKGGTGLSFHDTRGGRPTTQIVLTLPWTATELDQMLGRTVRTGMKSDVRMLMPTTGTPVEAGLARVIGARLQTLGYAVRGGEASVPPEILDAFNYNLSKLDASKVEKLYAAIGESALEHPQASTEPKSATSTSGEAPPPQARREAKQPLLLSYDPLPLFPNLEPEPKKPQSKPSSPAQQRPRQQTRPATQPVLLPTGSTQPPLFDEPLTELAKALGYQPGMALLIKAEERTIPVKRLKWVDRPRERKAVPASHFLLPEKRKFPYRNKDGSINCALLRAAISRAAQHGYKEVEEKARRLYLKHCKKKQD